MAKKHQIFSSAKKTRTKAGRKWRRQAKQTLTFTCKNVVVETPSKPKTPPKPKPVKDKRSKGFKSYLIAAKEIGLESSEANSK